MSQHEPDRPTDDHHWRDFLLSEWEQQILDDDEDFDLQLIAAYADGNVSDAERREVEKILARSPAALDLVVTLRQQLTAKSQGETDNETESGERPVASTSPASTPLSAPGSTPGRANRRVPGIVAAAGLIVAVGVFGWALNESRRANQLGQQVASLDQRLIAQAQALTLSHREQLLLTDSTTSPFFFAGRASRRLLEEALADDGSRGRGNEIPEVQAVRRNALASVRRSLSEWQKLNQREERPEFLISQASLEIVAGALDAADSTIARLSLAIGDNAPIVRNLRAGRLLALAETQTLREGNQTRDAARSELEQLTKDHPKFADGWLNLALLLQRTVGRDDPATRAAWVGYLNADDVPEQFRDTVKKHLKEIDEME